MVWTCTKNVQSIRHLRSSDVEQSANDSQKFQHLVKLQICSEVSLVYLTILEAAPTVTICDGALNRFYVLWRHRNYRRIIIIIIIITVIHHVQFSFAKFHSDSYGGLSRLTASVERA